MCSELITNKELEDKVSIVAIKKEKECTKVFSQPRVHQVFNIRNVCSLWFSAQSTPSTVSRMPSEIAGRAPS